MYSWQIGKLLEEYNYVLDNNTYISMCNSSPQINHVRYEPYGDYFEMWDCNGNYWKFKVTKGNDI